MDPRLANKIRLLGKMIPREWKEKGVIQEKPLEGQKEKAERLLKKVVSVPEKVRRRFYDKLESGFYDKTIDRVDEKMAKKIDTAMENIVRKEMESGRLKPMPRCCIISKGRCRH